MGGECCGECGGGAEDVNKKEVRKLYEQFRDKNYPELAEVEPSDVSDMQSKGGMVLVDVRPEEERSISMIPGAVRKEDFEKEIDAYKDKVVVTYCTIGYRSGLFAKKMCAQGMDARNLKGSILGWTHEGLPVEDPASGKQAKRVHVNTQKFALAPSDFECVWFGPVKSATGLIGFAMNKLSSVFRGQR